MAKYIALINWTELGVRQIKESPARADIAHALAAKLGGRMEHLYMTMGNYDLIAVLDLPDDDAMAQFALTAAASGHLGTTTLKAFDEARYRKVIAAL